MVAAAVAVAVLVVVDGAVFMFTLMFVFVDVDVLPAIPTVTAAVPTCVFVAGIEEGVSCNCNAASAADEPPAAVPPPPPPPLALCGVHFPEGDSYDSPRPNTRTVAPPEQRPAISFDAQLNQSTLGRCSKVGALQLPKPLHR
jgi:hypothetical protein